MSTFENIVLVKSQTRLEQLKMRFNTISNARFYMDRQGQLARFDDLQTEDSQINRSMELVQKKLENLAPVKILEKHFLANYLFSKKDLIIVVGQDGLVANTAKYANGIPIIGVNPAPDRFDGILLPFQVTDAIQKVKTMLLGQAFSTRAVTMAEAKLDDGQRLLAFNDLFIGPKTHTSARYILNYKGQKEVQSSSGIIISTGAGSTGWMSSIFNMTSTSAKKTSIKSAVSKTKSVQTLAWDAQQLLFAVREPFQSRTSTINYIRGGIDKQSPLVLESQMPDQGVIFSDGIQEDFLTFTTGRIASIGIAEEQAILVSNK